MPDLPDPLTFLVAQAITTQLDTVLSPLVEDLQIPTGEYLPTPTTPALHIRPAGEPFGEQTSFGDGVVVTYLVLGVVSTAEHAGAQKLLYALMDPFDSRSVRKAINANPTLDGLVQGVLCAHPSDWGTVADPSGRGVLMGCSWSVRVELQ